MLLEVAKHEEHATTALTNPNRLLPTRVGMVFYQHNHLIFPHHTKDVYPVRRLKSHHQMYEEWKRWAFVPVASQLNSLKSLGFKFPDGVKVKKSKKEKTGSILTIFRTSSQAVSRPLCPQTYRIADTIKPSP